MQESSSPKTEGSQTFKPFWYFSKISGKRDSVIMGDKKVQRGDIYFDSGWCSKSELPNLLKNCCDENDILNIPAKQFEFYESTIETFLETEIPILLCNLKKSESCHNSSSSSDEEDTVSNKKTISYFSVQHDIDLLYHINQYVTTNPGWKKNKRVDWSILSTKMPAFSGNQLNSRFLRAIYGSSDSITAEETEAILFLYNHNYTYAQISWYLARRSADWVHSQIRCLAKRNIIEMRSVAFFPDTKMEPVQKVTHKKKRHIRRSTVKIEKKNDNIKCAMSLLDNNNKSCKKTFIVSEKTIATFWENPHDVISSNSDSLLNKEVTTDIHQEHLLNNDSNTLLQTLSSSPKVYDSDIKQLSPHSSNSNDCPIIPSLSPKYQLPSSPIVPSLSPKYQLPSTSSPSSSSSPPSISLLSISTPSSTHTPSISLYTSTNSPSSISSFSQSFSSSPSLSSSDFSPLIKHKKTNKKTTSRKTYSTSVDQYEDNTIEQSNTINKSPTKYCIVEPSSTYTKNCKIVYDSTLMNTKDSNPYINSLVNDYNVYPSTVSYYFQSPLENPYQQILTQSNQPLKSADQLSSKIQKQNITMLTSAVHDLYTTTHIKDRNTNSTSSISMKDDSKSIISIPIDNQLNKTTTSSTENDITSPKLPEVKDIYYSTPTSTSQVDNNKSNSIDNYDNKVLNVNSNNTINTLSASSTTSSPSIISLPAAFDKSTTSCIQGSTNQYISSSENSLNTNISHDINNSYIHQEISYSQPIISLKNTNNNTIANISLPWKDNTFLGIYNTSEFDKQLLNYEQKSESSQRQRSDSSDSSSSSLFSSSPSSPCLSSSILFTHDNNINSPDVTTHSCNNKAVSISNNDSIEDSQKKNESLNNVDEVLSKNIDNNKCINNSILSDISNISSNIQNIYSTESSTHNSNNNLYIQSYPNLSSYPSIIQYIAYPQNLQNSNVYPISSCEVNPSLLYTNYSKTPSTFPYFTPISSSIPQTSSTPMYTISPGTILIPSYSSTALYSVNNSIQQQSATNNILYNV
ncbi:hypothetical protein WA158_001221 [Blastocystis sp. Blastoise]